MGLGSFPFSLGSGSAVSAKHSAIDSEDPAKGIHSGIHTTTAKNKLTSIWQPQNVTRKTEREREIEIEKETERERESERERQRETERHGDTETQRDRE